jgi:hypothetical protein
MTTRPAATASIEDEQGHRVKLQCHRCKDDNRYYWYAGDSSEDAGVSGDTLQEAKGNACRAWGDHWGKNGLVDVWHLTASWL